MKTFYRWLYTRGWRHIVVLFACVIAIFPLLYVFSASLNPIGTLTGSNQLFTTIDVVNYVDLFTTPEQPFGKWLLNTLYIGGLTSLGAVFMASLAAYAFSRMRFSGRRFGLMSILLIQMFPQLLAVVAIFLTLSAIGDIFPAVGIGSQLGLIMVYLGGALGVNTYLIYGYFNSIPASIDEAAKIDGAGHAQIFFRIILRLAAPILAVVGLIQFISVVGEYVIASVVLTDPNNLTAAVGLFSFVAQQFSNNWSLFAAGAVVTATPVIILFLLLQRFIVGGLTAGSVK